MRNMSDADKEDWIDIGFMIAIALMLIGATVVAIVKLPA